MWRPDLHWQPWGYMAFWLGMLGLYCAFWYWMGR